MLVHILLVAAIATAGAAGVGYLMQKQCRAFTGNDCGRGGDVTGSMMRNIADLRIDSLGHVNVGR